ncbi:MAG: ABC transporter ATP-binding protein [Gemmata sp.]
MTAPTPAAGTAPSAADRSPAWSGGAGLRVAVRRKAYAGGPAVLGGLEFTVDRGEFVTLLGSSGCGKTTLLRLIAGLDTDYDGEITVAGVPVRGPGPDRGVVFQESRLLPWLTAEQNVAFALPAGVPRAERARRVAQILELVHLSAAARAWPHQLSGGMEKRVALARGLVNLPAVLLLDEPLAAVDLSVRFALQEEVARVHDRERLTTLLVTHDVDEAVHLSDRVLVVGGRPARVTEEVRIDLPRPRSRSAAAVLALRQSVAELVLEAGADGKLCPGG